MEKIILSGVTKSMRNFGLIWFFLQFIPCQLSASWNEGSQLYTKEGISITITEKNTNHSGQASLFFPFLNEYFQVRFDSLEVQGVDEIIFGTFVSIEGFYTRPTSIQELEILAESGRKPGLLPRLLNEHVSMKQVRLDNHLLFLDGFSIQNGITSVSLSMILNTPEEDIITFTNSKVIIDNLGEITWCNTRLFLSDEVSVNNNELPFTIKGSSDKTKASAIEFDCDGFKSFRFYCEYRFDRSKFIPVKTGTNTKDTVTGNFIFESDTLWQFIGKINIDAFELVEMPGFQFGIENAVVDLDTRKNDAGLATLINSDQDLVKAYGTIDNTWQGFFMKELFLKLPPGLGKSANAESFSLAIKNLIADANGASGIISATPALPRASLEGWGISLDSIDLKFVQNAFKNSSIKGKVNIPIMSGDLKYQAYFLYKNAALEMGLTLTMDGIYQLPMLKNAALTLSNGSNASISYKNKKFTPQATLNGKLTVMFSSPKLEISLLEFQSFKINDTTLKQIPNLKDTITGGLDKISIAHFKVGNSTAFPGGSSSSTLSPGKPQNVDVSKGSTDQTSPTVSNFPFFIKDIKFGSRSKDNGTQYGLSFTAGVNMMEDKMTAAGLFSVWAGVDYKKLIPDGSTSYEPWKAISYTSFEWNGMYVNADLGAVYLKGELAFVSDKVWGEGFKAALEMKIKSGLDLNIWCTSQFGTTASAPGTAKYRYFFVDAGFATSAGIPLGPVSIHGFSGGFFYNMQATGTSCEARAGNINPGQGSIPDSTSASDLSKKLALGVTSSGAQYVPQKGIVSFKAGVILAIANSPQVFSAEVEFGMQFNTNTKGLGINTVYFSGNGYIMSESLVNRKKAPIKICVNLQYDKDKKEINGSLGASIFLANGFVQGGYNNKQPNDCKITNIHFNLINKEFYFYFGLPPLDQRFNITMNVFNGNVSTKGYFAVIAGKFSGLPTQMLSPAQSLGQQYSSLSFPTNSQPLSQPSGLKATYGVSFGARIGLKSDFNAFVISGNIDAVLGADVQFGFNPALACGQNGWFFQGQVYAGLKSRIKVFGLDAVDLIAAAALTVKFPNPFYAQGVISGKYTLLGGLIGGCFNTSFEVGRNCGSYNPQTADPKIKYGDIVKIRHVSTGALLKAFGDYWWEVVGTFKDDVATYWQVQPVCGCNCTSKDGYVRSGDVIKLVAIYTSSIKNQTHYLQWSRTDAASTKIKPWFSNKLKNPENMTDGTENQKRVYRWPDGGISWVMEQDGGGLIEQGKGFRLRAHDSYTAGSGYLYLHSHGIYYKKDWGIMNGEQEVTTWHGNDGNDWFVMQKL